MCVILKHKAAATAKYASLMHHVAMDQFTEEKCAFMPCVCAYVCLRVRVRVRMCVRMGAVYSQYRAAVSVFY